MTYYGGSELATRTSGEDVRLLSPCRRGLAPSCQGNAYHSRPLDTSRQIFICCWLVSRKAVSRVEFHMVHMGPCVSKCPHGTHEPMCLQVSTWYTCTHVFLGVSGCGWAFNLEQAVCHAIPEREEDTYIGFSHPGLMRCSSTEHVWRAWIDMPCLDAP